MANVFTVDNVKGGVVRDLAGNQGWLMSIENTSGVTIIDAEVLVGNYSYSVYDAAAATARPAKSSTSVVADKGVQHTVNTTTASYYDPVKLGGEEVQRLVRNGILEQEVTKLAIVMLNNQLAGIETILVDTLSDGSITKTATLADGQTNFRFDTVIEQAQNLGDFTSVMGQVAAYNGGNPPDWVIAHPTAWGNLVGSSNQNTSGIAATPGGKTAYSIYGIPMWAEANGTTSKWGAASKACVFMGANRHLVFRMNALNVAPEMVFETATGYYVLPFEGIYTYGVDLTGTTGLALGIGEVINGVS